MRLFVAVWPPSDVVAVLAALPRPAVQGLRWTTPDQWHVTLRFLGDVAEPEPVADALSAATLPAARLTIGPDTVRVGRDVAALTVAGADELAAAVGRATDPFGRPAGRGFRGHLTLARSRRGRFEATAGLSLSAAWDVTAVDLVRSELHPDGARYTSLRSVPVGA